jgi:hypothetical protein
MVESKFYSQLLVTALLLSSIAISGGFNDAIIIECENLIELFYFLNLIL